MGSCAPSPVETAHRLVRGCDRAALATATRGDRWPHSSLVLTACRFDGAPLMLLSRLAVHTRNLAADPRICLLYDGTAGRADPLTGPRASVRGHAAVEDDPEAKARFLRRHPSAERYAGFADFALYGVAVERVHLIAGFGVIEWIDGAALKVPDAPELAYAEAELVDEANRRHAGARWRVIGIDPLGIDLRAGSEVARREFDAPVETPQAARRALSALAPLNPETSSWPRPV